MLNEAFESLLHYLLKYGSITLAASAGFCLIEDLVRHKNDKQDIQDYFRHFYLIGKTGCGKSTTIRQQLYVPWISKGYGCMVIETKDKSTVDDLLNCTPEHRHKDVVVFDVLEMARRKKWIGLNLLEDNYKMSTSKTLITGEVMSILKRHFGEQAIQARSEDYFRNAILAALDQPNSTIIEVYRMLADSEYREQAIPKIKNDIVRNIYKTQFNDRPDALAAPLNKLNAFLSIPEIINVMSQPTGLNIRQMIEEQKIILVLLPKGIIGEDASKLLASMFLSKVQLAAQSRANIPKSERFKKPFMVIADEFQDYANKSFNAFLEQARGFGISLVIAHQLLNQEGIEKTLISSILGNVSNFYLFKCGIEDSQYIAQIARAKTKKDLFGNKKDTPQKYDKDFFENLPNHQYVKKIVKNDKMLPPIHEKNPMPNFLGDYARKLRAQSIMQYGVPERKIKENIRRRLHIGTNRTEGVF